MAKDDIMMADFASSLTSLIRLGEHFIQVMILILRLSIFGMV
jgi:hypothetical protein